MSLAEPSLLFSKIDSFAAQRREMELIQEEIQGIGGNRLLNTPIDDLVEYFQQKYRIDVPTLQEDRIETEVHEVDFDVSRDAGRDSRGRPILVRGSEISYTVPFQGDETIFNVRRPYPTDCVRAGSVRLIMRCDAGGQLPAFRRSSNNTANWLSASFQVLAGMIHFFSIFRNAR